VHDPEQNATRHQPIAHPIALPSSRSSWALFALVVLTGVGLAVSSGVLIRSRAELVELTSMEQGLALLGMERGVGLATTKLSIAGIEGAYWGHEGGVAEAQQGVRDQLRRAMATLDALPPHSAWVSTRTRLDSVTVLSLDELAEPLAPIEALHAGWRVSDRVSGIFPSDTRGTWSDLLDVTLGAQYAIYRAPVLLDRMAARDWDNRGNRTLGPDVSTFLSGVAGTTAGMAGGEAQPSPFVGYLDPEQAREADSVMGEIVAGMLQDPLLQRPEAMWDYLSGNSNEHGFESIDEAPEYARALLARLEEGAGAILRRSHELVAVQRRTVAASALRGALGSAFSVLLGALSIWGYMRTRGRIDRALRDAAEVDSLTGVANRFALFTKVRPAMQDARRGAFAVLHMDMDDFKAINDRFGHHAGDEALGAFAAACSTAVRSADDVLARIGGDEFVLVLMGLKDPGHDAGEVAERIYESLATPVLLSSGETQLRVTIGIAVSEGATDLDSLLEQADSALIEAKAGRRNAASIFSRNTRRNLVREVGEALDRGWVRPAFQPIVRATDGRVVGVEALARWTRPDQTVVPPTDFVSILASVGEHRRWLRTLLEAASLLLNRLGDGFTGRVWINVAANDLIDSKGRPLTEELAAFDIAPNRLGVELMEPICEADVVLARRSLQALRERGVMIALDDLGSDSIPLRHLAELPLDRVKIDGSLVRDLDQSETRRTIVEGLLAACVRLGLPTVAEQVESMSEERTLVQLGVTYLQGHRFGEAMALDELVPFLERAERVRRGGATA